ncbi:MAG: Ig-like domain-containing protein [Bacillota bacterium]
MNKKLNLAKRRTLILTLIPLLTALFFIFDGVAQAMPAHPVLEQRLKKDGGWDAVVDKLTQLREINGIDRPAKARRAHFPRGLRAQQAGPGTDGAGVASQAVPTAVAPAARTLVVMVDFSDKPGSFGRADFQNLFFGSTSGTARDYFIANSYGAFDLQGDVAGGPEGGQPAAVWLRLPSTLDYYAGDSYGYGGYPQNSQKLAEDAVGLLKANDFDWTPYRASDGTVPYLVMLHAGQGAEVTGRSGDLWSLSWSLSNPVTVGETTINNFILVPEQGVDPGILTTIGVFCHEYGHALGLPDLYDTVGRTEGGVGNWSLMAAGGWLGPDNDGSVPASLDAFCRSYFGWSVPETPVTGGLGVSMIPVTTGSFVYALYPDGNTADSEYFLVENRQNTGYDTYLPGKGLLIWHVDHDIMNPGSSYWQNNTVNVSGVNGLQVEEADNEWEMVATVGKNRGDAGDPFPGATGNIAFTPFSAPDSNERDGNPTGISFYNIAADGDNMTGNISLGTVETAPAPVYEGYAGPVAVAVYGSGTQWSSVSAPEVTLYNKRGDDITASYIVDGSVTVVSNVCLTFYLAEGLTAGDYLLQVCDPIDGPQVAKFTVAVPEPSCIENPGVTLSSHAAGAARVTYTINFNTSFQGGLEAGEEIRVVFPGEVYVPSSIDPVNVLVNGAPSQSVSVSASGVKTVIVRINNDIPAESPVEVKFLSGAKISNPTRAGSYTMQLSTTADTVVASAAFEIIAATCTAFTLTGPTTATAEQEVSFSVTAKDSYNNVVTIYSGPVLVTSTDSLAVLPETVSFSNGTAVFPVTFRSAGTQQLTVTDSVRTTVYKTATVEVTGGSPLVTGTDPADGATGVSVGKIVTATFNETVVLGDNAGGIVLKQGGSVVAITYNVSGNVLTIDPVSDLDPSTNYAVYVPAGAVRSGSYPLESDYSFGFKTEIKAISTEPADGATGVPVNIIITVTFSDTVGSGDNYGQIDLKDQSGTSVSINKSLSGVMLTIDPTENLKDSVTYTVYIPAGAVKDQANNALANDYIFSFKTQDASPPPSNNSGGGGGGGGGGVSDTKPPAVVNSVPVEGAAGVSVDQIVTVNFDEDVKKGGAFESITLKDAKGNSVGITKELSGKTLTLKPAVGLGFGTKYTVLIPAGAVEDQKGNALAKDYTLSFTTAEAPPKPAPVPAPASFSDIEGHWAADTIARLADMSVIGGFPDGTFGPDKQITRVEITAILVRALNLNPSSEQALNFSDNARIPSWARGAIAAAAKEGLVKGCPQPGGGISFEADRPVSRAELAAMLARVLEKRLGTVTPGALSFADTDRISGWARNAVAVAYTKGIIGGYSDNTFRPDNTATRAEAASMVLRLLDMLK